MNWEKTVIIKNNANVDYTISAMIKNGFRKLMELIDATIHYSSNMRSELLETIDRLIAMKNELVVVPIIPEPVDGEIDLNEDVIGYWWVMK